MDWFILASGPSLTQNDVDLLKDKNVIAINDNYKLAPWAKVLYACDAHWWVWHKDSVRDFKGELWTQSESWSDDQRKEVSHLNIKTITSKGGAGLSTDPDIIYQGANSGYQAINLAYHFGAKRIILLGYDMQNTGGKSHWFGEHPNGVSPKYNSIIPFFQTIADQLPSLDLEVINCTRETQLECFAKSSLEDVL